MTIEVRRRNESASACAVPVLESKALIYVICAACLIFVTTRWGGPQRNVHLVCDAFRCRSRNCEPSFTLKP
jgi:hypothetical protein